MQIAPSKLGLVLTLAAGHAAAAPADYTAFDLDSLGGTVSRGNSVNTLGVVAGYSNLPGNRERHAAMWAEGRVLDLGTLGGPNSSVAWPVKNNNGIIAGISQLAAPDPLGERWSCAGFFPGATGVGRICRGFAWEDGTMRELPTLGGTNGFAAGANNRGEITGWAENTTRDPTCTPPQVLQFRPVVWGPGRREMRELPLLPGDSSGAATAINDRGQAIGISGSCDQAVGRHTARHAVLWDDDGVTDLGNIGGVSWNTPMALNYRGDVVGFAATPGPDIDDPNLHAFLWTRSGGMRDLGALPGHVYSEAHGINQRGQVVGISCDAAFACRAFLWEDGTMTDLNARIDPGYGRVLETAQDINELGVVTGRAFDPATGARPAFVAVPRDFRSTDAAAGADDGTPGAGARGGFPPVRR
jgi:probable HAF family extracellular repeat protein